MQIINIKIFLFETFNNLITGDTAITESIVPHRLVLQFIVGLEPLAPDAPCNVHSYNLCA